MPIAKNPNGARTDAERRAQNKWDQANRVTLGVRVSKADGEAFRAWCAARGQTVNAALSAYVTECLQGGTDSGAAPAAEIVSAAQPGQAAGGEGLTLPADVARLASLASNLAGDPDALTWARRALEAAAAAEADARERRAAAMAALEKFKPEQTAPGNSGDLPPEQAGSKTPGD